MSAAKSIAAQHPELAAATHVREHVIGRALHQQLPLSPVLLGDCRDAGNGRNLVSAGNEQPHGLWDVKASQVPDILVVRAAEESVLLLQGFKLGR